MTVWYTIKTLDGRTLSRTHGVGDKWHWIAKTVAADAECKIEDVDLAENEEGDIITVKGEHYARVITSSHDA